MAYTFDKIDDYFRKNKTGSQGSLQKGTMGTPAPTKAAESLARVAETSPSGAGAYRAQKGEDVSAVSSRLLQPAQQQMTNWQSEEGNKFNTAMAAGNKQITDKYTPFNASDVAGAEAGNASETEKLRTQVGYTGKEIPFQAYNVAAPTLDTTSFLRSGVGGVQAGLQKKGGRYTPGMAALDASVFSANRPGVIGLQNQVGGMQSQIRADRTGFETLDETLTDSALNKGTGIASTVRSALTDRAQALREALKTSEQERIKAADDAKYAGFETDATRKAEELIKADPMASGEGVTLKDLFSGGYAGMDRFTPGKYIKGTPSKVNAAPTANINNLASILGISPESLGDYGVDTTTYEYDPYGIEKDVGGAISAAMSKRVPKNLPPIKGEAPGTVDPGIPGQISLPEPQPVPPPPPLPAQPLPGSIIMPINPQPGGDVVSVSEPISYNPGPSVPPPPLPAQALPGTLNLPTVQPNQVNPFEAIFRYPW